MGSTFIAARAGSQQASRPTKISSPEIAANVIPMRPVRVSVDYSGTPYYLFTGYVERWPITWDAPTWGSVTLTGTDGMAALEAWA